VRFLRIKKPEGILTSLDVESLYTNVPIDDTIKIILDYVYRNDHKVAPKIPEYALKQLLEICTKDAPFQHINGEFYQQIDGIAMGSPLGCIFANFYMCHIENNIIPNLPKPPALYARYVDDILLIVDNESELNTIKEKFNDNSALKFTSEIGRDKLPFLDVFIENIDGELTTSVYTKPSNNGNLLNYNSECPIKYKKGVINTMLLRASKICSSQLLLEKEIQRLRQVFTNNNFPMKIIDDCIATFRNKIVSIRSNDPVQPDTSNSLKIYYNNQMNDQYKKDEKIMRDIIANNIKANNPNDKIQLVIYYNSSKTRNLIMRNKIQSNTSPSSSCWAVYEVSCPYEGCELLNPSYIGQTRNTLRTRLQQHTRDGAIKQHIETSHRNLVVSLEILEKHARIVKQFQDFKRLIVYEALLILNRKPQMNRQIDNFINPLKLFSHSGTNSVNGNSQHSQPTTAPQSSPRYNLRSNNRV